jgi:hypothetical protein
LSKRLGLLMIVIFAAPLAPAQMPPIAKPAGSARIPTTVTPPRPDDPAQLTQSSFNVHTGKEWRIVRGGNGYVVYRDNPPMTGVADLRPGGVFSAVLNPDPRTPFWRNAGRFALWYNSDISFEGSEGHTFRDARGDGTLGIAPVGELPRGGTTALTRVRWYTNGLQLEPGQEVELRLRKRLRGGAYERIGDAWGAFTLAPNTRIVAVAVAVIEEPGMRPASVDRAMAELWFDGRANDRHVSVWSADVANVTVFDRDVRPGWTADRLDAPEDGRLLGSTAQDPDAVWSYCGVHFDRNIQFRLIRFGVVRSDVTNANCAHAASEGNSQQVEPCITDWARELERATGDSRRAITIAVVPRYPRFGTAQTFASGVVMSTESFSEGYGVNTIAHEIGHVFGGSSSVLFSDGHFPQPNLMAQGARAVLTREQCNAAYESAKTWMISGPR